ncbi:MULTISPECIES: nuclease-related domain-containing protein [Streptomyces]|uniref:NERD domain-containing protein n=1 Tax=Streptomyces venezuelae TaxID=54571 RepID=A0A5P2BM79_STRVZ|nr:MULTISPECIES: nuclease-related domain-containing protein [Streptomyces]MYY81971.1 NERD domain-containing protein [Streptomyces sp. SID335]MYZ12159.1 NERD domain-containing protein [Streptomyces sp. SID337]MYZ18611.1 NERD domain-containing protein [Streptomyces sp. SID337]NDZ87165.1 NERD domain-containing protein [Streptomyces sp. SID10115]NEB50522.1 NERD domain-containing protein [Streptomyces sp. SID339]
MTGLRVVPAWRHGQERLYVYLADGRNVAWYDREASRVNLLSEESEEDVLDVLAPFLTGQVTVGPPPVPTPAELARLALHPDDDLAPNRPGEALRISLDRDPAPARRLRADARHRALAAEQAVGETLDALEGAGWRVLHSLPLPGDARIHHLLIGPGGLFCVGTLAVRKQRVRIADPMVTVGRAEPFPLLRSLRSDAGRASFALTAEVRPVLVLAGSGAADLDVAAPPRDVRVLREADLPGLARLGGVLKPADVEALHALARDRRTWERV